MAPFVKPRRGAFKQERDDRKAQRKAGEEKTMRQVRREDGNKCRVPRCHYDMKVDVAHDRHRGMGGNPAGDRTIPEGLLCLCRWHHDDWDRYDKLKIEPQTARGFRGPCDFYGRHEETGAWVHIGSERVIGESVTRLEAR